MWRNWEPSPALRRVLSGSTEAKGEFRSSLGDRKEDVQRGPDEDKGGKSVSFSV